MDFKRLTTTMVSAWRKDTDVAELVLHWLSQFLIAIRKVSQTTLHQGLSEWMVYSCLSNLHGFALKSRNFSCNLMFSWWIPSSYWLNSCFCWFNQLNPHSCWGSPGIFADSPPPRFQVLLRAPLARGRRAAAPRKRCQSVVATLVTFTYFYHQSGWL